MDYQAFKKTVSKMTLHELGVAMIIYLKDIKDLLESICDAKKIPKKHY